MSAESIAVESMRAYFKRMEEFVINAEANKNTSALSKMRNKARMEEILHNEEKTMFDALYKLIEQRAARLNESGNSAELIALAELIKQTVDLYQVVKYESAIEFLEDVKALYKEVLDEEIV